jgi:hypothetical protein
VFFGVFFFFCVLGDPLASFPNNKHTLTHHPQQTNTTNKLNNRCGDVLDFIATLLLGLWWIAASLALSSVAARGNLVPLPQKEWRTAVIALSWSSAGLALIAFAMHSGRVCSRCCGKGRRKRRGDLEDGGKAGLFAGGPGGTMREPSAAVELGREVRGRPYLQQQQQQQLQQGGGMSSSFSQQPQAGANALRTGLNQPSF